MRRFEKLPDFQRNTEIETGKSYLTTVDNLVKSATELIKFDQAGFDCGTAELNKYLRRTARQHLDKERERNNLELFFCI